MPQEVALWHWPVTYQGALAAVGLRSDYPGSGSSPDFQVQNSNFLSVLEQICPSDGRFSLAKTPYSLVPFSTTCWKLSKFFSILPQRTGPTGAGQSISGSMDSFTRSTPCSEFLPWQYPGILPDASFSLAKGSRFCLPRIPLLLILRLLQFP